MKHPDPLGRRYDLFGYNARSEVTSSKRYTGTDPARAGLDPETIALRRSFDYDALGNRRTSQEGTATARVYTANALNQYTAVTAPSAVPSYDADGNQIASGEGWWYDWDGENRLTRVRNYAATPVNGSIKVEMSYDYRSRRVRSMRSTYSGTAWLVGEDRKFVYDDWNLLAELKSSDQSLINTYVWGLDLSRSLQGAGGVGGLLAVNDRVRAAGPYAAAYDANGNVSEYINPTGGIEAHFEYDAFGKLVSSTGSSLERFAHRFSTKYWDGDASLYCYGLRYYNPGTGGWVNRDPIGERGGMNLYAFIRNMPINRFDYLGLCANPQIRLIQGSYVVVPYSYHPDIDKLAELSDVGVETIDFALGIVGSSNTILKASKNVNDPSRALKRLSGVLEEFGANGVQEPGEPDGEVSQAIKRHKAIANRLGPWKVYTNIRLEITCLCPKEDPVYLEFLNVLVQTEDGGSIFLNRDEASRRGSLILRLRYEAIMYSLWKGAS